MCNCVGLFVSTVVPDVVNTQLLSVWRVPRLKMKEISFKSPTSACVLDDLSTVGKFTGQVLPKDPSLYQTLEARMKTFATWDGEIPAESLASAGFINRHLRDQTQCVECFLVIENWKPHHNVEEEHRYYSPNCSFIKTSNALESQSEDEESISDDRVCKICYSSEISVAFHPCNHLVCCRFCSYKLKSCPICRCIISHKRTVSIAFDELPDFEVHGKCKVSHNNDTCSLLIPCKHVVSCADQLVDCPLCQTEITETMKLFIGF
jgi:Inhibitor of Apoptosis domain/Zinc finger, C3HC4 type (RING finger)